MAAEDAPKGNGLYTVTGNSTTAIASAITGPTALIISCGSGEVSISMKTGKVELKNCTEDEGARRFWDAIQRMYPGQIPH